MATSTSTSVALRWSFLQQVGRVVPSYLGLVLLSRLLSPSDFGLVGVAGLWLGLLNAFVGGGFGPSVVQARELSRDELSSLASTTVLLGAAAAAVGVAIANPMCQAIGVPEATPYAQVSALAFVFAGFGIIPAAIAQRRMTFKQLAQRDTLAGTVSVAVAVVAALLGAGPWALVLQPLVQTPCSSALIWWSQRRAISLGVPRWSIVREHAGFSGEVTLFQLVKATLQTSYRVVIAAILGPHALGLYMMGYKLAVETTAVLRAGLGGFLFPFMARRKDDRKALSNAFVISSRALLSVTAVALAGLTLAAPLLVPFIFGETWRPAVVVVQVLSVVAITDCIFGTSGELMKATGHSRGLLLWSLAYAVTQMSGLIIGAELGGITGTAVGAASAALLLVPLSVVQAGRRLHEPPSWVTRQLLPPIVLPTCITVVGLLATELLPTTAAVVVVAVALVGLLGIGVGELRRILLIVRIQETT